MMNRRAKRWALAAVVIGTTHLLGATVRAADADREFVDAVVSTRTPKLNADGDEPRSTSLEVTNLTAEDLTLTGAPDRATGDGCRIDLVPSTIDASSTTTVEATATDCELAEGKLTFDLVAGTSRIGITASEPEQARPDWNILDAFAWTIGCAAAVAAALSLAFWRGWWGLGSAGLVLRHLDSKWSFKDAWAANVTVLGAILTGVLGTSSVVKAILGDEAESAIAVSIVGVAIATAFAGAGPVIMSILKWGESYTVFGLFWASAVVIGAALGELYVVANVAINLDTVDDTAASWITLVAGLAATGLVLYVVTNFVWTYREGTTAPGSTWDDAEPVLVAAIVEADSCCPPGETAPRPIHSAGIARARTVVVESREEKAEWPTSLDPTLVAAVIRAQHCCGGDPVSRSDVIRAIDISRGAPAPRVELTGSSSVRRLGVGI